MSNTYKDFSVILTQMLQAQVSDTWPDTKVLAKQCGYSDVHFTRLFKDWVGTTPDRFISYVKKEALKERLASGMSVLSASEALGLSSVSRAHDLMLSFEAMTPGDYGAGAKQLQITWGQGHSPYGPCCVAQSEKGLLAMTFGNATDAFYKDIVHKYPKATFVESPDAAQALIDLVFSAPSDGRKLHLQVKGTNFQIKVWEALLQIPPKAVVTYGAIAKHIGHPKACRAVGTAVGANPIAYLIPCHRVIQQSGVLGGYRWDPVRKLGMLGQEFIC